MPISLSPIATFIAALAFLGAGWFVIDEIGDRREAKVHKRYSDAAELTNVDVRKFNSDDEKVAAVAEALRQQALDKAKALKGEKHPATKEQAAALSAIRWP